MIATFLRGLSTLKKKWVTWYHIWLLNQLTDNIRSIVLHMQAMLQQASSMLLPLFFLYMEHSVCCDSVVYCIVLT